MQFCSGSAFWNAVEAESSVAARLRKKMLGENFESEYSCCQMEAVGFAPCCANQCACFKDCPTLGLCLEACCCSALSVSFSRIYAMHRYNVRPDPWDWKCIEFSNCMQCLSCICHVAASIDKNFEDAAQIIDCIADCVYHVTVGCMVAQTSNELNYQFSLGTVPVATAEPTSVAAQDRVVPTHSAKRAVYSFAMP